MAAVTLLLVVSLFFAVRRLRTFILVAPEGGRQGRSKSRATAGGTRWTRGTVGTLLRDALAAVRLAAVDPERRLRRPGAPAFAHRDHGARPWPRTEHEAQ